MEQLSPYPRESHSSPKGATCICTTSVSGTNPSSPGMLGKRVESWAHLPQSAHLQSCLPSTLTQPWKASLTPHFPRSCTGQVRPAQTYPTGEGSSTGRPVQLPASLTPKLAHTCPTARLTVLTACTDYYVLWITAYE